METGCSCIRFTLKRLRGSRHSNIGLTNIWERGGDIIQEFTYEDFDSGRVFEYLSSIKDPYEQGMEERRMAVLAEELKFKGFKALFRLYKEKLRSVSLPMIQEDGISEFGDQPFELNTGEWTADEGGVWRYGGSNGSIVYACSHPIMPIQRMRGVDTGLIKVKLAFRRNYGNRKAWNEVVVDARDIASANKIVDRLSSVGVSVTSGERANALVDYLRDMLDLNQDVIPEVKSVSRMGWNEEGFSPYTKGIVFDSADSFSGAYKAITQAGSYDAWKAEALDARSYSLTARIVLAASFGSVLVGPLGCLPFFVHLWGMDSGTGKTVAQMLGASVWANPTVGQAFFPTFRGTTVGFEMMAGFLHSIPLFLDDLQLAKDKHGNVVFNVYDLASGSGKLRSNRALGLNYTPTWANCFITSGETPIVGETDGAGALNRVIEIECRADEKAIRDGHRTANVLKANYGWAGREFVSRLMEDRQKELAAELYDRFFQECTASDTTDKQAMAAAVILAADALATEWIFRDGRALTVKELGDFLKTREAVSLADRGYEVICDWVAVNASKMRGQTESGDCYGLAEGNMAYIIRSVFNRVCAENAINPKALLSHLRTRGLIETGGKGYTKPKRMGGQVPNCVWLHLPTAPMDSEDYELPL